MIIVGSFMLTLQVFLLALCEALRCLFVDARFSGCDVMIEFWSKLQYPARFIRQSNNKHSGLLNDQSEVHSKYMEYLIGQPKKVFECSPYKFVKWSRKTEEKWKNITSK